MLFCIMVPFENEYSLNSWDENNCMKYQEYSLLFVLIGNDNFIKIESQ